MKRSIKVSSDGVLAKNMTLSSDLTRILHKCILQYYTTTRLAEVRLW